MNKTENNCSKIGKELIKTHKYQEIIVTGSRKFELLELLGVWLHIIALGLGIFALAGVGIAVDAKITHWLEILTLVVVALIIVQHAAMPIAERMLVKKLLRGFWGVTDVPTRVSKPTDIDISDNFGTVKSTSDSWQIERTEIKWTVVRWVPFKKVLTVQQSSPVTQSKYKKYAAEDGNLYTAFMPLYIIIDVKNKEIKFQGRTHIVDSKFIDLPEKRVMFTFHYREKLATWSGVFPENPLFGEWMWDKEKAKKLAEKARKIKAETRPSKISTKKVEKKTSKVVAKEFKSK